MSCIWVIAVLTCTKRAKPLQIIFCRNGRELPVTQAQGERALVSKHSTSSSSAGRSIARGINRARMTRPAHGKWFCLVVGSLGVVNSW